MSNNKLSFSKY